ncbi:hypothetical protein [Spirosoma sp. KNUC1025]|uniref:hypothetical protein n=1 Tax=Spirosoma sp. KNUC1025 TaxID=2894082 RepID=UPI0038636BF4|nr:hypothetical protein LN737_10550 [Spirosoma sp. KNUC1025]
MKTLATREPANHQPEPLVIERRTSQKESAVKKDTSQTPPRPLNLKGILGLDDLTDDRLIKEDPI